jgi:ribosomal protein S18 acetylase RimI-like enzyme
VTAPDRAEDLVARANRSLAASLRDEARHVRGAITEESGDVLLTRGTGAMPYPPNRVMAVGPDPGPPAGVLARAGAWFEPARAGYSVQLRLGPVDDGLRDAALAASPLIELDSAAMALGHRLGGADVGPAELRRVTDAAGVADYSSVVDEAYQSLGWPAGGPAELFADPASLLHEDKVAVVAYLEGRPAAAAYVLMAEGLALVSWVGTTTAARRRGLGEAVTRAVVDAGFDAGATAAWLTASAMGEAVYRRLGFTEFARARSVVLWPTLERPGA